MANKQDKKGSPTRSSSTQLIFAASEKQTIKQQVTKLHKTALLGHTVGLASCSQVIGYKPIWRMKLEELIKHVYTSRSMTTKRSLS